MLLLADITNVDRTDLKPYCLLIETKDRRLHLSLKNDDEVYGWKDDIYARSPLMGVSNPVNFVHKIHVGFDPNTGNFTVSILSSSSRERAMVSLCRAQICTASSARIVPMSADSHIWRPTSVILPVAHSVPFRACLSNGLAFSRPLRLLAKIMPEILRQSLTPWASTLNTRSVSLKRTE